MKNHQFEGGRTDGLCAHEESSPEISGAMQTCGMRVGTPIHFVGAPVNNTVYTDRLCGRNYTHTPHDHGEHFDEWCNGDATDVPQPEGKEQMAAELEAWWLDLAQNEILRVVPKAVEYGSTDLHEVGRTLAQTQGRIVEEEEAVELGIYFYLLGKMARWTDAIKRGERPSDDTLHDIGVYVRMAQRTRQVGGWPNGPISLWPAEPVAVRTTSDIMEGEDGP